MDAQRSNDYLPQLPEEIIEAVLLKAPVETVVRFRCVSNRWRSLIGTKRFIAEHLKTSPAASSVIFNLILGGLKQCDVDSPICQQFVKSLLSNRRFGPTVQLNVDHVRKCVVGCVDGLVCLLQDDGVFSFWNPSTRVTTLLPKLGGKRILTPGFGFDESTGEFKVFAVEESQNKLFERKVYSSMSKSWKVLETTGILSSTTFSGNFVCGKLHWPRRTETHLDIVSYDIKTEAFDVIELPVFALSERRDLVECIRHLCMGVLGGHLSALLGHSRWEAEVWVMEKYGVKESWTKVVKLQPPYSLSAPFCTGPKGEILFIYGFNFLAYNPKRNVFRYFGYNSSFCGVHHFVKSLVTPDYAFIQGLIN